MLTGLEKTSREEAASQWKAGNSLCCAVLERNEKALCIECVSFSVTSRHAQRFLNTASSL